MGQPGVPHPPWGPRAPRVPIPAGSERRRASRPVEPLRLCWARARAAGAAGQPGNAGGGRRWPRPPEGDAHRRGPPHPGGSARGGEGAVPGGASPEPSGTRSPGGGRLKSLPPSSLPGEGTSPAEPEDAAKLLRTNRRSPMAKSRGAACSRRGRGEPPSSEPRAGHLRGSVSGAGGGGGRGALRGSPHRRRLTFSERRWKAEPRGWGCGRCSQPRGSADGSGGWAQPRAEGGSRVSGRRRSAGDAEEVGVPPGAWCGDA